MKKKSFSASLATTSMVDMMFILLIFFVIVSTIRKDSIDVKATKVDKSKQKKNQENKKTEKHVVTIDKKNLIYVNGKKVETPQELESALGDIKQKTPQDTTPTIVLRPDADSQSSKLIEIFGALNAVGLSENVQIEVDNK